MRRLSTTLLGGLLAALVVLGAGAPAHAAKPHKKAPTCPAVTVDDSTKRAMAVFSGVVTDVQRAPRTDGQQGAIYTQTVTVDLVYQGKIDTETVTVQTDRNRAECSLGALAKDVEYMFFVTGNGQPWIATGGSGTRISSDAVAAEVVGLIGEGRPPIDPTPETASFTPVDTSEPQSFTRSAAPGAALVLVGLLGLVVVRGVSRGR
ncbi:hypothetical protein [Nocardioides halotolerans]|jgi:hypothetical protein|uniref:hypothetical protein n=1 Tax=Nocardioides halotolerans TaxID=433660 RepID=UPI00042030A1|nr:hypothetical protein [Nocardioides halotolerans]